MQKRVKRDDSIWSEDTDEKKEPATTHLLPGMRLLPRTRPFMQAKS